MSEQTAATANHQISELKVSAHLMSLEPGLYCVFSAPGGASPDPSTGLPVVRITPAPGVHAGRIRTGGLETEGWIRPDAATLVRVTEAKSELLVTVYQAAQSRSEPPAIQVVRLSGSTEGAPAKATAPQPAAPKVEVVGHIYARGDVAGVLGEWMGEPGSKQWLEGFGISPAGVIPPSDIEYQAVLGRGWLSPWSEGGQFCGSRGMSLPILGLRVRLRGASADTHRVVLTASFVDGTKIGPVGDNEACEAPSLAALEAFQLSIVPNSAASASVAPSAAKGRKAPAAKPAAATKAAAKAPAAKAAPAAKPAPVVAKPEAAKIKSASTAKSAKSKIVEKPSAAATPMPRAKRTPAPRRR